MRRARFRRRARRLGAFAWACLTARQGDPLARALTPAAWGFVAGWFGLLAGGHASPVLLIASLALFVPLCVAALIDALYFVLPDGPLLAVAGVGLLVRLRLSADIAPWDIASCLGAGLFAYLALALAARAYQALRGHAGLGGGDPLLFALAGLWLGFDGLAPCLLLATASALLSVLLAWRSGAMARVSDPLPFGPHIALGLWLMWTFGPRDLW
jgi:leader peptidase (prepilin peptidase)/N-methyltransferase